MWYIVLSHSQAEQEENKKRHVDGHTKWLEEQHRGGRLLFSGPTTDGAYGIYILLASNRAEAEKTAAQDPYHLNGVRRMEVLEWRVHRAFRLDGATIADVERMATGK
jgi:hypothetical protein